MSAASDSNTCGRRQADRRRRRGRDRAPAVASRFGRSVDCRQTAHVRCASL